MSNSVISFGTMSFGKTEPIRTPAPLKYAALVIPFTGSRTPVDSVVGDAVDIITGSVMDLVEADELKHWRSWRGEIAWSELESKSLIVVRTVSTQRPNVADEENEKLMSALQAHVFGVLLTGGVARPAGTPFILSGCADSRRRLRDVRYCNQLRPVVRGYYGRNESFLKSGMWNPDAWHAEWSASSELLNDAIAAGLPPTIGLGLVALQHAFGEEQLEFRIPEFVRAAETILALPRNKAGAKEFANRSLLLDTTLAAEPFLSSLDLRQLLEEVFQLRSDCVHGKLPFEELVANGPRGELRVAQLEFAAEHVARKTLSLALAHSKEPIFASRTTLEESWRTGSPFAPG